MDEIYLSPDIEEQIVQQLQVMTRGKKLHVFRHVIITAAKALPILLALAVIAALLTATNQGTHIQQKSHVTTTTRVDYSTDGHTKTTTTTRTQTQ